MGKASSSKKVARAARAGGRSTANKQRNLLFPGVIGGIMLVGAALVAVAASDRKSEDDIPPALGDHWHAAVGIDICGEFQPNTPEFESDIGIHTHGDGVIHIHPFSANGAGENATLGAYLEAAGIELSDTSLTIGDETWDEGDQQCDGEDAELVVAQWKDVENTDDKPALIRRDFGDIRFRDDGEGYTIGFLPEGTTEVDKPESAAQLAELGAADAATATTDTEGNPPDDSVTTTVPGDSGTTAADPSATTTAPAG
jgi:hypothetical protein